MAKCLFCATEAVDPEKGPSRWARAVISDEQVLVCPDCQTKNAGWLEKAESCVACGSKKLYKSLGDKVCRSCGHQWSEEELKL